MKCICGYEFIESFAENTPMVEDEPFLRIQWKAYRTVGNDFTSPEKYDEDKDIGLFGCPKCKTVQFQDLFLR